jgi:hypothetical protein
MAKSSILLNRGYSYPAIIPYPLLYEVIERKNLIDGSGG